VPSKANFDDAYTQPDPRAYYATMGGLDYEIPTHGAAVFRTLLDAMPVRTRPHRVLDVCSSYGVNAALLNHDLTFDQLVEHYAELADVGRDELLDIDLRWFAARRRFDLVDVVGLDVSAPAVQYAAECGLLAGGIVADLESDELEPGAATALHDVDLVTVTGGIGYVTGRTFARVLDATATAPWVAALVLRWVDLGDIAPVLESRGLVLESLDGYAVPQRRFADEQERQYVLRELDRRGIDPAGLEAEGRHVAELVVARPAAEVARQPLADLFAVAPAASAR
jgi:hypothetical protein